MKKYGLTALAIGSTLFLLLELRSQLALRAYREFQRPKAEWGVLSLDLSVSGEWKEVGFRSAAGGTQSFGGEARGPGPISRDPRPAAVEVVAIDPRGEEAFRDVVDVRTLGPGASRVTLGLGEVTDRTEGGVWRLRARVVRANPGFRGVETLITANKPFFVDLESVRSLSASRFPWSLMRILSWALLLAGAALTGGWIAERRRASIDGQLP